MSEMTPIERMVQNDPLTKEGTQTLVALMGCLFNDHPFLLHPKQAFKCQFVQYAMPHSKAAKAAREEFWSSQWTADILQNPASWFTIRDAVQDHVNFAIKCLIGGFFAQFIGFGFWLCVAPEKAHPLLGASIFLWQCSTSLHFKVDLRYIRQWDRMWENSAVARIICPDHPAFHPPRRARKFIAFTHSPEVCFDVLSDLDEGFEKLSAEFGFRYARTWYVWNALKSLSPSLDALIGRLTKWGAFAGFIEFLRHLLAQKG